MFQLEKGNTELRFGKTFQDKEKFEREMAE